MSWHAMWHEIFNFEDYGALLGLVRTSLVAGAVLGLVGGLAGTFVVMRDLAFAVHGISELSFAGAAAALLLGTSVAGGSIARRARRRRADRGARRPRPRPGLGHRRADAVRARPRRAVPVAVQGAVGQQVRPPHRADRRDRHAPAVLAAGDVGGGAGVPRRHVAPAGVREPRRGRGGGAGRTRPGAVADVHARARPRGGRVRAGRGGRCWCSR
nr:metal ABC transporter permease [Actinomadura madurae]